MAPHILILAATHGGSTASWLALAGVAVGAGGAVVTAVTMIASLRAREKAASDVTRTHSALLQAVMDDPSAVRLKVDTGADAFELGDLASPEVRAELEDVLREAEQRARPGQHDGDEQQAEESGR